MYTWTMDMGNLPKHMFQTIIQKFEGICHVLCLVFFFITELADCEQNNLELEVLQNNYSILYWAISACDIVPALFSSKLITCSEMEEINSHSNSGAKNTALLAALRRRPHPLHQFCHILSTTPGQEDLAKQLLHGIYISLLSPYFMTLCA